MSAALRWLRRWGISCASLAGGVLTLFVFRRGLPHVSWIIGYLLILWMLYALLTLARPPRLVTSAMDYTVQTLYHGLLLFVLPAYYAAATLTSSNVVFLLGVGPKGLLVWQWLALPPLLAFSWYAGRLLDRPGSEPTARGPPWRDCHRSSRGTRPAPWCQPPGR